MSYADTELPVIPKPIAQALLDAFLGTTLVQSLLTGLYAILFLQTIVPLIRDGKRRIHTAVLTLLFSMVIINLGTTWQILRDIMITHNDTRNTMVLDLMGGPLQLLQAANATSCIAIFIADTLLIWRCYVLWKRNKILLAFFTLSLLGEVALITITVKLNIISGNAITVSLFFFLSIGITVLAMGLIIYRVATVSNRIPGETSRYQYLIEVLGESGVMYSITLLIADVLLLVRGNDVTRYPLVQAVTYWGGILIPVIGIAPTLITMRTVHGRARDETTWTQPLSGIFFNNAPNSQTERSSSDNGRASVLNGFSAHYSPQEASSAVERKPSNESNIGSHEGDMVSCKEHSASTPGAAVGRHTVHAPNVW